MTEAAHAAHPLATDVAGEQRAEPVPPHPHGFMTDVDPALEQPVFHISLAERIFPIHHHHEADYLG